MTHQFFVFNFYCFFSSKKASILSSLPHNLFQRLFTRCKTGAYFMLNFPFCPDKPPEDPKERKWYLKRKQQYTRHLRFYGNSLVGGSGETKIITVTESTEPKKKKKGKNKEGKMVSFYNKLFITERH